MIGQDCSQAGRITCEAFHEFGEWMDQFSRMVREHARKVANAGDPPGLITSATLKEAVRTACQDLVAELTTADTGRNSNDNRQRTAA